MFTGSETEYITDKECARRLKVSHVTLWKMRKRGMPYYKLGGVTSPVRYKWSEVREFVESGKAAT